MKHTSLAYPGLVLCACLLGGCNQALPSKKISSEASRQARLDWNVKTLVTVYQKMGNTDIAWDAPAAQALTEFARTRAQVTDPGEPWVEIIATNCDAAVQAGCDDPMIRYLYIRFSMSQTNTPKAFSDALDEVAGNMQASAYPDLRKFYASLRAYQQFTFTYGYGRNVDFKEGYLLLNNAVSSLATTLNDKRTPPEEIYDACSEFVGVLPGDVKMFNPNGTGPPRTCWILAVNA